MYLTTVNIEVNIILGIILDCEIINAVCFCQKLVLPNTY